MPYRNGLNRACGRRAAETLRLHQTCGELCKYDRPDISRLGLVSRGYAAPSDVQKLAEICSEIGQPKVALRENVNVPEGKRTPSPTCRGRLR
ncbi:MAG: hypothetical protein WHU94_05285 [Thermogemmata sp.]|jgi:hypothetical protein